MKKEVIEVPVYLQKTRIEKVLHEHGPCKLGSLAQATFLRPREVFTGINNFGRSLPSLEVKIIVRIFKLWGEDND